MNATRKLSDEQRRDLLSRGGALAALSQHPSWPTFEDEMRMKIEQAKSRATALALSAAGADQRELDTLRGSILALRWLLAVPTNAEARLESYLKKHSATTQDEGETE